MKRLQEAPHRCGCRQLIAQQGGQRGIGPQREQRLHHLRSHQALLPLFDLNLVIDDLRGTPACTVMRPGSIRSSILNGNCMHSDSVSGIRLLLAWRFTLWVNYQARLMPWGFPLLKQSNTIVIDSGPVLSRRIGGSSSAIPT
jgi:hypothetical protein